MWSPWAHRRSVLIGLVDADDQSWFSSGFVVFLLVASLEVHQGKTIFKKSGVTTNSTFSCNHTRRNNWSFSLSFTSREREKEREKSGWRITSNNSFSVLEKNFFSLSFAHQITIIEQKVRGTEREGERRNIQPSALSIIFIPIRREKKTRREKRKKNVKHQGTDLNRWVPLSTLKLVWTFKNEFKQRFSRVARDFSSNSSISYHATDPISPLSSKDQLIWQTYRCKHLIDKKSVFLFFFHPMGVSKEEISRWRTDDKTDLDFFPSSHFSLFIVSSLDSIFDLASDCKERLIREEIFTGMTYLDVREQVSVTFFWRDLSFDSTAMKVIIACIDPFNHKFIRDGNQTSFRYYHYDIQCSSR